MIRAYNIQHSINRSKQNKILEILKEYRKTADYIAKTQWNNFFRTSKFNKNLDINKLKSLLSSRYKQVIQYQVCGQLDSYIANRQNDFVNYVLASSINEQTRIKLLYINKYKKWFCNEIRIRGEFIEADIIKLARKIIKQIFFKNRKPNFKYINMALDNKVAVLEVKKASKAKIFDYWIHLSTLEKGKKIRLPLVSNQYFEAKRGDIKKYVQINVDENNNINVVLLKKLEKREYIPKTPKIALDLGLNNLFATNNGDLFGRGFSKLIKKYDELITELGKNRQKQKLKTASKKYKHLVSKLRNYLKNEINRVINRIVALYQPKEIIIEKLNFQSPKLSRKLNRILQNFGKKIITQKLSSLKEEFGIKITEINPAYTSKTCSKCGYIDKNNRKSQETFICGFCKSKQNADINASKNILARSSSKLKNIYLKRAFILDKLVHQFIERKSLILLKNGIKLCHNSLANILAQGNPYFSKVKLLE